MIIIPLLLGALLRVYKIFDNYYFTGELGKELLYVRELILNHEFPLVGLATSHEWLTYGPIYYWILIPIYKLFSGNVFILYWLALVVSMLGIYVTYWVFSKIVNNKFALILTFFISLSPIWVWETRLSKLHTFFFILMPLVIYFLYKIWNKDTNKMIWLGIAYGSLLSFHYSQLPILLVIITAFFIQRKYLKLKNYLHFIIGFTIPNLSIIVYDFGHGFEMTKNLIMWVPYRILGFVGLYPKNNLSVTSGVTTLSSFNEFFGRNLFNDPSYWLLGTIVFITLFSAFIICNKNTITKDFLVFYVIFSTLSQCLSLFVHTSPPLHYFLPIFLNFGILFAYFIYQNQSKLAKNILIPLVFVLLFISEILFLNQEHKNDTDYVSLKLQINTISEIIIDSKDIPFALKRIGPFDYFPDEYKQNYEYLLLQKGAKIDPNAKLRYVIIDSLGNARVIKENGEN